MNERQVLKFLTTAQNNDGGWGYAPGQTSSVEPTAAAILALRLVVDARKALAHSLQWLRAAQNGDGGWGLTVDDKKSGWQTAWAVLALSATGSPAAQRGAQWLLNVETPDPSEDAMQQIQPLLDIDLTLKGWPWQPGQATWIEPTALATLALATSGYPTTPRVTDAIRYLTDRRCKDGGWNVGNPFMFSQPFPPRAHPTAWALLALARIAPEAIMSQDITALRAAMTEDGGALALAWGLLALQSLGLDDKNAAERLAAQQQPDGSWNNNPYHTAIALSASSDKNLW